MKQTVLFLCLSLISVFVITSSLSAEVPEFTPNITDITVFKDGHALVMSRAETTFENGWCRTREVPAPVLGTFWAFTTGKNAKVDYVKSGFIEIEDERPCLNFIEMIQANVNKPAAITEQYGNSDPITHDGVIIGILEHESEKDVDVSTTTPDGRDIYGRYRNPQTIRQTDIQETISKASFVMLKSEEGVQLIKLGNIRGINLKGQDLSTVYSEKKEVREISLHVASEGRRAIKKDEIGFVYMQKGVRWIPSYNIDLLDGGKAKISLRAVIINDLADLDNVDLRLVVGVPSFVMKGNISPMALREIDLRLSSYFQPPSRGGQGGQYAYLSNAMMSQVSYSLNEESGSVTGGGPDIPSEGQNEDLFLYEKKDFSLKKGERAVIDLFDATVPYEDIYTWDIPPVPPREMWRNVNNDQQRQLAQALAAAKAMHKIRLTNTGEVPWTTGPAMIFKGGAILGQQLLTYTSVKNDVDLPVTVATDLNTKKEENETERSPKFTRISNYDYTKVSLHGKLTVKNFKDREVRIIVTRTALGTAISASGKGKIVKANALEDTSITDAGYPWYRWSWPWWWYSVNSVSRITWDEKIPAGESATFEYDWYYYYRH